MPVAVSTPSTSYTLLISEQADTIAGHGLGRSRRRRGVHQGRRSGVLELQNDRLHDHGAHIGAQQRRQGALVRSYTRSVYCGGAKVTLAPAVFDEVAKIGGIRCHGGVEHQTG